MCFGCRDLRVVVRLFRYWKGSSDWWTSIVHHYTNHCLLLLLRLLQVPSNQPRGCYRHSRSCPYGCHGNKHQEDRSHETAGQRGLSFTPISANTESSFFLLSKQRVARWPKKTEDSGYEIGFSMNRHSGAMCEKRVVFAKILLFFYNSFSRSKHFYV